MFIPFNILQIGKSPIDKSLILIFFEVLYRKIFYDVDAELTLWDIARTYFSNFRVCIELTLPLSPILKFQWLYSKNFF